MWLQTAPRAQIRGQILFFKSRLGWTMRHHKSPLALSNWRKAHIGGETTSFKQTLRGTRKQQQQHKSPSAAGISEGRCRLSRTSNSFLAEKGKLFISAQWLCCILYAFLCIFCSAFLQFPLLSYQVLEATRVIR